MPKFLTHMRLDWPLECPPETYDLHCSLRGIHVWEWEWMGAGCSGLLPPPQQPPAPADLPTHALCLCSAAQSGIHLSTSTSTAGSRKAQIFSSSHSHSTRLPVARDCHKIASWQLVLDFPLFLTTHYSQSVGLSVSLALASSLSACRPIAV